ncbi:hypothetical protein HTK96_09585 [Brevundimonas vesicularis]|uniref:hypothetical protein n=1 Tax=Brevundimonas vesicularis TaxID=41276 RepID=UPI001574BF32|nr:hypothetical protein [Brevundimonas vesicularis]NSX33618.1 hypothetical protein [Brevundimonas vesicularis]
MSLILSSGSVLREGGWSIGSANMSTEVARMKFDPMAAAPRHSVNRRIEREISIFAEFMDAEKDRRTSEMAAQITSHRRREKQFILKRSVCQKHALFNSQNDSRISRWGKGVFKLRLED